MKNFRKNIEKTAGCQAYSWQKHWTVESDGTMVSKQVENYEIMPYALKDKNIISHMQNKGWVDMNTFIPAYFHALSCAGLKNIIVDTSYLEDDKSQF